MSRKTTENTRGKYTGPSASDGASDPGSQSSRDIFADLDATLDEVAESNPRIEGHDTGHSRSNTDLQALLEVSLAINSSLVLEDVLQIVMRKAIELMHAERGLIMLLDDDAELQVKSAHNIRKEELTEGDFKISTSITSQVARTGRSVYTSDAIADDRYSQFQSVVELHLRSIMCVPIKIKEDVIGVIYLDNSSESKMFLKSDLYVFELFAQDVANALHNARNYDSLLRMKSYNETVVKDAPVGIIVVDDRGRIHTINAAALEILDINSDAVTTVGEEGAASWLLDFLPETETSRWQHMMNTVLAVGQTFSDPRYFHNTGYIEKVLSINISPLTHLPSGESGITITVEDITEKVLMEKYVIISEKLVAKGEMAASVSHELNNYLAIVSTNAELLDRNIETEQFDKARFNARSITENIGKIKRFVTSLMDFSKPEADYISYDAKLLIEDLLFSLRVQSRFKNVRFTIDLDTDMPNLEMDVGQIQQVLMNLLNNAADAIEERIIKQNLDDSTFKKEIAISSQWDEDAEKCHISVEDNGIGMTEETLGKIYTVHFTTKKSGHGLGLANCRKIIQGHHGNMEVESNHGSGSTFKITLPRFQPKKAEAKG